MTTGNRNNDLLSVCMLAYNHERFIGQAIEGFLIQKTNFSKKLVIGEDFSSDKTRAICAEFVAKYPEEVILLPEKIQNLGMIINFKRTLEACAGKYIAICEGDDYWTDPNKLQKQVDFLENNPDYAICAHNVAVKGDQIQESYLGDLKEWYTFEELASGQISIPTLSVVFRNYNKIPDFIANLKIGDFPLLVFLSQFGKIKIFPEIMGVRRVHGAGFWSSVTKAKQTEYLLETLSYMIGNYTKEINSLLINYHLKIIASSLNDDILPGFYPPELKHIAKKVTTYNRLRKILSKIHILNLFRKFRNSK